MGYNGESDQNVSANSCGKIIQEMDGSLLAHDLRRVISLVDLLRDIGLGGQLSLPKVVVLGNQSSGKSSLLEQIVGLDFLPRGAGVVTRRPLELRMNSVPTLASPYAEFDEVVDGGKKRRFTNFNEVRNMINEVTDKVCGSSKEILDRPIVLNVFSKSCPNLTIVDLPGITSIPVGKQPENIYEVTKQMAMRYIQEKRSIILCVIPANQDLATSEALKIMMQIDPRGERSIGCLTKIDIMNRGEDATKMLMNKEIPLRYGYVGIKNRCQEDITNNVPVQESLRTEKKYFTTSPIYSSLPSDSFGTESLTRKLTTILYQQIKSSMPDIFEEIKKKKKEAEDELLKLGPAVATTDAELVHFAWSSISSFLRIFKNSLKGIKNNDYSAESISATLTEELSELYREQFDEKATKSITEKDIQKAMINFQGDSTILGFPSYDAFLALLNPLLKDLQSPAYDLNNRIHELMEKEAQNIISQVMSKRYPEFNSRFCDLIRKILDKHRRMLESYLNSLLDWELSYLYTNDMSYMLGDMSKTGKDKTKADKSSTANELRKLIDSYYNLVVRNLRDLVPKQIYNFLIVKCLKELEFEAFQFTSDAASLKEWFNEPADIMKRRNECIKAIAVFNESEKRIRMDPDISKLLKQERRINPNNPTHDKFDYTKVQQPPTKEPRQEPKVEPKVEPKDPALNKKPSSPPDPIISEPINLPKPVAPPTRNPTATIFGQQPPPSTSSPSNKITFDEFINAPSISDKGPLKGVDVKNVTINPNTGTIGANLSPTGVPGLNINATMGMNTASKGKLGPTLPPPPAPVEGEKKKNVALDKLFGPNSFSNPNPK